MIVTGWLQLAGCHCNPFAGGQGRFGSLKSTSGAARLYTVELIMETQISAAWFDLALSKVSVEKPY